MNNNNLRKIMLCFLVITLDVSTSVSFGKALSNATLSIIGEGLEVSSWSGGGLQDNSSAFVQWHINNSDEFNPTIHLIANLYSLQMILRHGAQSQSLNISTELNPAVQSISIYPPGYPLRFVLKFTLSLEPGDWWVESGGHCIKASGLILHCWSANGHDLLIIKAKKPLDQSRPYLWRDNTILPLTASPDDWMDDGDDGDDGYVPMVVSQPLQPGLQSDQVLLTVDDLPERDVSTKTILDQMINVLDFTNGHTKVDIDPSVMSGPITIMMLKRRRASSFHVETNGEVSPDLHMVLIIRLREGLLNTREQRKEEAERLKMGIEVLDKWYENNSRSDATPAPRVTSEPPSGPPPVIIPQPIGFGSGVGGLLVLPAQNQQPWTKSLFGLAQEQDLAAVEWRMGDERFKYREPEKTVDTDSDSDDEARSQKRRCDRAYDWDPLCALDVTEVPEDVFTGTEDDPIDEDAPDDEVEDTKEGAEEMD